ncbi:hypothetical protein FACS1894204_03910 [Synergistales bacterium]|nr:hypothetical protein FACS1894204_03910 [Synergistales bacterium]
MINISSEQLERANKALRGIPGAFPKAIASATNRAIEGMRTDAASETSKRYHAKSSDIRKTMTLKRASAQNLQGVMLSRGSRRSLADYKLTGKSGGLMGAVKKDGLKSLGDAFLITKGGKARPYVRTNGGRWGMEPLVSPSIPQIVKNEETVTAMEKGASERFTKRLDHEVLRLLGAFQ